MSQPDDPGVTPEEYAMTTITVPRRITLGNLLSIGRNWVPQTAEANKIQQTAGFYAGQALLKKM